MKSSKIEVFGVGSFHGDDRAGWLVVDEINSWSIDAVTTYKLTSPVDLVERLRGNRSVHLVDAAANCPSRVMRLCGAQVDCRAILEKTSTKGTHRFGVSQALDLAEALQINLECLTLWLVAGDDFAPMSQPGARTRQNAQLCAKQIQALISDVEGLWHNGCP